MNKMNNIYKAEMLVNNSVVDIGSFICKTNNSIGVAWRRAGVLTTESPKHVVVWKHGEREPFWWAQVKANISLEKRLVELRGQLAKKTNTDDEIKELKHEVKVLEAQLKTAKKNRKKTVVQNVNVEKFSEG